MKIADRDSSVGRAGFGPQGSNLPAILEVILGSHSSGNLIIPRCKKGPGPGMRIQWIIKLKWEQSDGSNLALKPMGRVNWKINENGKGGVQTSLRIVQRKERNLSHWSKSMSIQFAEIEPNLWSWL